MPRNARMVERGFLTHLVKVAFVSCGRLIVGWVLRAGYWRWARVFFKKSMRRGGLLLFVGIPLSSLNPPGPAGFFLLVTSIITQ